MSGVEDHLIHEKPGHLIRRLQQIAVALFMSETSDFEITPVQYAALLAVSLHPGIDQTALVNLIAFDRSTIGDVVTRLATKKLIRRMKGEDDGRTRCCMSRTQVRSCWQRSSPRSARRNAKFWRLFRRKSERCLSKCWSSWYT